MGSHRTAFSHPFDILAMAARVANKYKITEGFDPSSPSYLVSETHLSHTSEDTFKGPWLHVMGKVD